MAFGKSNLVVRAMFLMLALLLAVPVSGVGSLIFFCTMTGGLGPKCCCQYEVKQDAIDVPSVRAAPCCQEVSVERQVPPTRAEVQAPQFETPKFVASRCSTGEHTRVGALERLALPNSSRGPPPDTWPPICIKHCSFLI